MTLLNALLVSVFDLLLTPFRLLPPVAGLAVVSLATAVGMLVVFKRTSDQARLAAVKRSIHAALFEIRLFNDDLRAILRAQWEILRHNATYLRLSMLPMVWVIVPLVLVVAQLQFHYGYASSGPGQPVLVKATLRTAVGQSVGASAPGEHADGATAGLGASLEAPLPIRVETPAVWLPAANEVVWKVAPEAAGEYELRIRVGGETHSKTLVVSDAVARRSPVRLEAGFLNQLLYPSEAPLPSDSVVSAITVSYAEGAVDLFGWDAHWMIVYFALSIVFAFMLRKPFGVVL